MSKLVVRAMVPKISVSTILNPIFTRHIENKTGASIEGNCVERTHGSLPFDVLQCNDVRIDRLESFVTNLSRLLNCKQIDPSVRLPFQYHSDLSLRVKLLFPADFVSAMRFHDEGFRNFNSDRMVFVDLLNNEHETALSLQMRSHSMVLEHLKDQYADYLDQNQVSYSKFDEVDSDIIVMKYGDLQQVHKNRIAIEHASGCSIRIRDYHENCDRDDLLEVTITGINRYNTVKGIRMVQLHRT